MKNNDRIKIGIDMHTVDGTYQGIRTHILEIFSRVIALCPEIDFYLFLQNPTSLTEFSNNFNLPNVSTIRIPVSSPFLRLLWFLPKMQKKLRLDYFHSQYIFPFPMFSKGLVTIHDILFKTHPQYFKTFFRTRSKILIQHAAQKSDHIFTVSNFSKESIIKEYKINPEKITVTYNSASSTYSSQHLTTNTLDRLALKSKSYILTVARNDLRKNYYTLLKAFSDIKDKAPQLVIVDSSSNRMLLNKYIEQFELQELVKVISNINNEALAEVYKNAVLFVYPSFAEGFGIPVIEAMTSGLCTIISNTTSLTEIGKDSAIFIDPQNHFELASAILSVLNDEDLRTKHEQLSINHSSKFSWDLSANQMASIYNALN